VGLDRLSSDFGKIVVGDKKDGVRIDVWSGHAQYPRLLAQMAAGMMVSARTGKDINLEGNRRINRASVALSAAEAKTVPAISGAINAARGFDFKGDETTISQELIDQFIPIIASDMYELWLEDPEIFAVFSAASFLGLGVQSFKNRDPARDIANKKILGKSLVDIEQELRGTKQKRIRR